MARRRSWPTTDATAARGGGITLSVASSTAGDDADYICDGTADDVQIQAAIDALPAVGGVVRLSAGTFDIAATVTLRDYVILVGQGPTATTLDWTGAAATHILDLTGKNLGTLADFRVQGPTAAVGSRTGYGMLLDETFSWNIRNVALHYLERGYTLQSNAGDNTLTKVDIRFCDVGMLANSVINTVWGGVLTDCETGITNTAYGGLKVVGVTFNGSGAVRNIDLPSYGEFSFTDCWFETSTTTCARIGNGSIGPDGTVFIGCHFDTTGSYDLDLQSGPSRTVVIGCFFKGPRAVLIGATHYYTTFLANGSDSGGTVTITDDSGYATVQALDYPPTFVLGASSLQIGGSVGFYGTTPATKQTVTGSRGSNAALASLLTALAASGLITDRTS